MKTHTNQFKEKIKKFGKQLDSIVQYEENGSIIELGQNELNSITPRYEGSILKSVMKELVIDSNVEIPIDTELNYKFGLKIRSGKNIFDYQWFYEECEEHNCIKSKIENGIKLSFTAGADAFIGEARNSNNGTTPALQSIAIKVKPDTTYTLSASSLPKCYLTYMDIDKEVVNPSYISIPSSYEATSYTFTTPDNVEYIGLRLGISNNQYTEWEFTNVQLEEGDEATEYEEFGSYEYLDFGNYIVKQIEKKEDTNSWEITCYDKLLYAMKDYENMNIVYPITIRNYINAICNHLGLTFANASDIFANYNKQIPAELYLTYNQEEQRWESLGYTFRDVLDEIAQATASTICINKNDELEIRYIQETNDTINGEYLKNINVNFGEHYGPINTIILSRSGDADNIYLSYPENLPDDEKIAIKISDNQILNRNDRDSYMSDILTRLLDIQYYINDFSSPGICYYDLCDRYTIQIDNNNYSCVMLNDEINITQGLEENINAEMPEEAKTDYSKADKTDRRINQTYIIVDKQNQQITSVVSQVGEQNSKISTLTQTVDTIESEIQNITGLVQTQESDLGSITFEDTTTQSEPITIKVHPIGESISYLYPTFGLYPTTQYYPAKVGLTPSGTLTPSNSLTPSTGYPEQNIHHLKTRKIRFHNNTTNENIDYELPDDLLYYDAEHYDEFYLNYESRTCQITKKCEFNLDGTVGLLTNSRVDTYTYPTINLTEGTYSIYLLGYGGGYIYGTLMTKNIYTDQFYTKAETDSKISQTATDINLNVSQTLSNYSTTDQMNAAIDVKANQITSSVSQTYATKTTTNQLSTQITQNANSISAEVSRATDAEQEITGSLELKIDKTDNNQIVSMINASANRITLNSNRLVINSDNFNLSANGTITAKAGTIGGWTLGTNRLYSGSGSTYVRLDSNQNVNTAIWCGSEDAGNAPFRVTKGGALTATNVNVTGSINATGGSITGASINIYNGKGFLKLALTDQNHPFVSALNVASQSANPSSISSISFRNTNNRNDLESSQQIGYISYGWNGGAIYQANGNMNVQTGGAYGLDASSYIRLTAGSGQEINLNATGGCFMNGSDNARIYVYRNCVLQPASGYYAYVGPTDDARNRIATQSLGPSSLNVKKNLVSLENEYDDLYKDIQHIGAYNYDYKYKNVKDNLTKDYGFIIDEIEDTKHLSKYFRNYKAKIWLDKDTLKRKSRDDEDMSMYKELEIKEWDTGSYIKGLFVMIKALQHKIDELEGKINE